MEKHTEETILEITLFGTYGNQETLKKCKQILENLSWDCKTSIKIELYSSPDLSFTTTINENTKSGIIPYMDAPEQIAFYIKKCIKEMTSPKNQDQLKPPTSWKETIKKNGFGTLSTNM